MTERARQARVLLDRFFLGVRYKRPTCASVVLLANHQHLPLQLTSPLTLHTLNQHIQVYPKPQMISTRAATRGPTTSKRATAQLIKSFQSYNAGFRPTFVAVQHFQSPAGQRHFSSSPNGGAKIVEFFEKHPTEKVRKTHAAWPHPGTYPPSTQRLDN